MALLILIALLRKAAKVPIIGIKLYSVKAVTAKCAVYLKRFNSLSAV